MFCHNFAADFEAIAFRFRRQALRIDDKPPFAFIRFGDGEAAVMAGRSHFAKSDGWRWTDSIQDSRYPALLRDSLTSTEPGIYLGISSHSHHPHVHAELMPQIRRPLAEVTFAELFIFDNYRRWQLTFRKLIPGLCFIVGQQCEFAVPSCAIVSDWDFRPLVDRLIAEADRPILVSAGPVANCLIRDYWLRCPESKRQTILDVGSSVDEFTRRRQTRRYHNPSNLAATWTPAYFLPPQ